MKTLCEKHMLCGGWPPGEYISVPSPSTLTYVALYISGVLSCGMMDLAGMGGEPCSAPPSAMLGPIQQINFHAIETFRALGLGWGILCCQQAVVSGKPQPQPRF
ncbi:hypothetical protein ILYODFUR_008821 [Ilyodon furcidens]|uniref:Uncharacterized protein n=1 Tax=Ilyodon furcidens TaxID=33524 RepID=A0ABV0TW07_9TELE